MVAMKQPKKRKTPERSGKVTQAYIDPEIRAALDRYIEEHNNTQDHPATITSTIEAALKKYLAAAGHWPPPSAK